MDDVETTKVGAWMKAQSDCPQCDSIGMLWEVRGNTCRRCMAPLADARSVTVELAKIWLRVQKRRRG